MQLLEKDKNDLDSLKNFLKEKCEKYFEEIDQAFLKEDFNLMLVGLNRYSYYLKALDNLENHKVN